MPLYEYQCESCHQVTERIQKFSDPLLDKCPSCGGPVKKLVSSPAFQFKGTGFYITDYARKGETSEKAEKSGTSDKSGSSDKAEKSEKSEKSEKAEKAERSEKAEKSETKPASKTE